MAERTGKCEIRANCYVRQIEVDKAGRVTGATYFDGGKREVLQRAKAVVVCCNGSETPRLLQMSKSSLFPNGLANSSGLVGEYLMLESTAFCGGTFEHALNDFKSVQVSRVLHDFYDADPKRGFFGGGGIDASTRSRSPGAACRRMRRSGARTTSGCCANPSPGPCT